MQDMRERLFYYRRLSASRTEEEALAMMEEMEDRFGPPPPQVLGLLEAIRLKIEARKMGIRLVRLREQRAEMEFLPSTPIQPEKVVARLKEDPAIRLHPEGRLTWQIPSGHPSRTEALRSFLQGFQG